MKYYLFKEIFQFLQRIEEHVDCWASERSVLDWSLKLHNQSQSQSAGHSRFKQLKAEGIESAFPVKYFSSLKSWITLENKLQSLRHDYGWDVSTGESLFFVSIIQCLIAGKLIKLFSSLNDAFRVTISVSNTFDRICESTLLSLLWGLPFERVM